MAQVIIRNLNEEVVERLKQRAQSRGLSLEQQLRDILTAASEPSREEIKAELARIRAMTPRRLQTDSAELIREDRDNR
jgi:plasmid stability protein